MTTAQTGPSPKAAKEKAGALHRDLGLLDATMLVMGAMIGSGIFITSAESARLVGAPGWLLVAWALAGLMTVSGALASAELAAMMPRAGGQYVFLRFAYGPMFGFLFGWSMFLVVQTGTIAAVAVAFAKFLGVFLPSVAADVYLVRPIVLGHYALCLSTQQIVALVLIAILTFTNTRGLRLGALIQNSFTFAKTAALIGLIAVGLTLGVSGKAAAWTSSWWNSPANGWSSAAAYKDGQLPVEGPSALVFLIGLAMIGPLFSQSAWNNVTFTGGETRDPARTLPRALFLGTTSVVVLYLLANLAYLVIASLRPDPACPPRSSGHRGDGSRAGAGRPLRDGGGDPGVRPSAASTAWCLPVHGFITRWLATAFFSRAWAPPTAITCPRSPSWLRASGRRF